MGTKILMPEKAWNAFQKETGVDAPIVERRQVSSFEVLENGRFRLPAEERQGAASACVVVELEPRDLWRLDSWESGLYASRGPLVAELQSYFAARSDRTVPELAHRYRERIDPQDIPCSDIYLLIPGRVEKGASLPRWDSPVADHFNREITQTVETECRSRYAKDLSRSCLGQVEVYRAAEEEENEPTFLQFALIYLAVHRETRLCVLEVHIPNCDAGCNYVLNYFRQGKLLFRRQGEEFTEETMAAQLGITLYGQKRSMVFAYGELTDRQIICALANEYAPMGEIGGVFARKVREENLAQYDTARVYVSTVTMIECCPLSPANLRERIEYQVIEIFFVELLLLNDASVDKTYRDLRELEEELRRGGCKDPAKRLDQINLEMSQALQFADFDQFYFPTVRESSRRIAKDFGIDVILSRYGTNKSILTAIIEAEQRRTSKLENDVKNRFLFLLTSLSVFSAISGALDKLNLGGNYTYFMAIGIAGAAYGLYHLILRHRKRKEKE